VPLEVPFDPPPLVVPLLVGIPELVPPLLDPVPVPPPIVPPPQALNESKAMIDVARRVCLKCILAVFMIRVSVSFHWVSSLCNSYANVNQSDSFNS
jgi:hypothetical protein